MVFRQFSQPRRYVAAEIDNVEGRTLPEQLMFPSHAAGCDRGALRKASETTATRQKTVDAKTQPQKPGKLSWDLETKTWGFA